MKKIDIDNIDPKELTSKDSENMPEHIRNALSQKKADDQFNEIQKKIDYEPRDWAKGINKIWVCGVIGEAIHCICHLNISTHENSVSILAWNSRKNFPVESFRTKKKLNSFIDALKDARDIVFGA